MPTLFIKQEKSLEDLAQSAYGKLPPVELQRAVAALAATNAHLAELGQLSPGMAVVVPPILGIPPLVPPAPPIAEVPTLAPFHEDLIGLRDELGAAVAAAKAESAANAKLFSTADVTAQVRETPEIQPFIAAAKVALTADATAIRDLETTLRGIDALIARFGGLVQRLPPA